VSEASLYLAWGGAYLLGSVPFGLLVGRASGRDPRRHGSGNIGATNVARAAGVAAGLLTLALDAGKGAVAVWAVGRGWDEPFAAAGAAVAAVLGHAFPVFLRLRGGKGVATAAGAFLVLAPWAALAAGAVFLAVVGISRYVSLGSMCAAGALPLAVGWLAPGRGRVEAAALCALLVVLRHGDNLRRLAAGTESRLGNTRS
jgi:glycerol-3-phosphate acyltransferase PlsY